VLHAMHPLTQRAKGYSRRPQSGKTVPQAVGPGARESPGCVPEISGSLGRR
jgi:hypothetical protein